MQITRTRGDTHPDVVTVRTTKTKQLTNLSACQFKLTVSTLPNPVDAVGQVYQITGVVADPLTGVVTFTPTLAQANQLGFFYYDIQMTDSFGTVITLVKDTYLYKQDITK